MVLGIRLTWLPWLPWAGRWGWGKGEIEGGSHLHYLYGVFAPDFTGTEKQ